jgi:proteasome lid subunit RPN8/RPN11
MTSASVNRRTQRAMRQREQRSVVTAPAASNGALRISRRLLTRIEAHARQAYPEECCGILVGVRRGDGTLVTSAHPALNRSPDGKCDRYELDPSAILRVARASERQGQQIVGFYHSHPDHPPAPSRTDAERAWEGYVYVISGVAALGRVETRAWIYDDKSEKFSERPVRSAQKVARAPYG